MINQVVPDYLWLAGNVAAASVLVSLIGLFASRGLARTNPSSGHWGLMAVCVLLLAIPSAHLASQASGIAWSEFDSSFARSAMGLDQNATTATPFQIDKLVQASEFAVLIWLFGAAMVACRSIAEFLSLRRWMRMTKKCDHPATSELVARAAKLVGIRSPEVRITSAAICPMVVGVLKPKLVLPAKFQTQLSSPGTLAILVHECEHIRRRDNFWNLFCLFGIATYWWNPMVRQLVKAMDRMCERACDDRAIETTGALREYASVLVDLARINTDKQFGPICQSLLGGRRRPDLPSRIARLRDATQEEVPTRSHWLVILLMILAAVPLAVPIGLPSIQNPFSYADITGSNLDDGVVYMSLDASNSNAAEALSGALHRQQELGNQLIIDLRSATQSDPANLDFEGKMDLQRGRPETVSDVSIVLIVSDENELSRQIRDLIASTDESVQILNTNTNPTISEAEQDNPAPQPLPDQISSVLIYPGRCQS